MNEADALSWAYTGDLRSRAHIAVIEPYQTHALCGVGISGMNEIRPLASRWCDRCLREARKRGAEGGDIGLENDLSSDRVES